MAVEGEEAREPEGNEAEDGFATSSEVVVPVSSPARDVGELVTPNGENVNGSTSHKEEKEGSGKQEEEEKSLFPRAHELPVRPPRAIECNHTHWAALDVGKEFHDQYIYRHANGLCVIGLLPTHSALNPTPAVTAVDFNVGKQNRADQKVSGKRKKNAILLEPNSVLCKVMVGEAFYLIRCCVRGVLLEVNERLIKDPTLLNTRADTEGHIAIIMPRPEDWLKASKTLLTFEQYRERREVSR